MRKLPNEPLGLAIVVKGDLKGWVKLILANPVGGQSFQKADF